VFLVVQNFNSSIRNTLGLGTFLVGLIPPLPDRGYRQRNWGLYFKRIADQLEKLFTDGVKVFVACNEQWETIKAVLLFICADIRGNKTLDNAQAPSLFGACDDCDIRGFQISRGLTIYPYHCRCCLELCCVLCVVCCVLCVVCCVSCVVCCVSCCAVWCVVLCEVSYVI
jgi:hypothetical protein